jgi:hypothetical protein
VKWTLLALSRDPLTGAATGSMKTAPVNQSLGPALVLMAFLVICMLVLLSVQRSIHRSRLWGYQAPLSHDLHDGVIEGMV